MQKIINLAYIHWPKVVAACAVLLLAAVLAVAAAETVNVSWTHPTQYTNGAALPASDLKQTEVRCVAFTPTGGAKGACPRSPLVVPAPATSAVYDLGTVPPSGGLYEFDARTTVVSGASSDWSVPAGKTFAAIPPKPPVLTVAAGATAYEIQLLGNGAVKLGRNVGTVTQAGACGAQFVGDFYAVAGEAVDYYRTPKSSIVVAECS